MGFDSIPPPQDQGGDYEDVGFAERVSMIFPDASSSRLARVGGVATRTAQKWLSGEAPVPADVDDYVRKQFGVVKHVRLKYLEDAIQQAGEDGVDNEVIAAHLSLIYGKITGQKIR